MKMLTMIQTLFLKEEIENCTKMSGRKEGMNDKRKDVFLFT
jgi:hypothetical protein